MMRHYQNRIARKASKKALFRNAPSGVIAWIRAFNRFQLGLVLLSLAFSVLLLFTGTYVTFDASLVVHDPSNSQSQTAISTRSPLYDTILSLYGINEADFRMLYPDEQQSLTNNYKLTNYRIGISMMFVGAVSILAEVGLVCAILFEHLKLSFLYTFLLASSLLYGLFQQSNRPNDESQTRTHALSITYQLLLLLSTATFSFGIKWKGVAANRILDGKSSKCVNGKDIELSRNDSARPLNGSKM